MTLDRRLHAIGIDLAIVLALLEAAVAMFAASKPRMDAGALIVLTVLPLSATSA